MWDQYETPEEQREKAASAPDPFPPYDLFSDSGLGDADGDDHC